MEFRLLGPVEVADGERVLPLAGSKQRALLAILLLSANHVVSSDQLIEDLWGEQSPRSGRTALQVLVSQLRKALGERGAALGTQPPGYILRLDRDELDVRRFERLIDEADQADPPVAAERLREALSLWRGRALADLAYEAFAQPAIQRLEELRLAALERRIEADLALGRHVALVAELQSLTAEHPLRERPYAQLMLALYRCDRQADALGVYRSARQVLVEQLGIEPSGALRELEQAILRQDRELELAPAAAERSLLAASLGGVDLKPLLALAAPLARTPGRALVVARLIAEPSELPAESAALQVEREALLGDGIVARAAVFTSRRHGIDAVRIAIEIDCELLLIDAPSDLLENPDLQAILESAPCDVGALVGPEPRPGPVLVPFVGAEHDWAAIELGAWLAGAWQAPLRLAGPSLEGRDSSRLLASASLAVQQEFRVAAEPVLLAPDADVLVRASREAALVIVGLSDRWQREGLGTARTALAERATTPVLLVRRGLRPGGLAPRQSLTRFTWSLRPQSA